MASKIKKLNRITNYPEIFEIGERKSIDFFGNKNVIENNWLHPSELKKRVYVNLHIWNVREYTNYLGYSKSLKIWMIKRVWVFNMFTCYKKVYIPNEIIEKILEMANMSISKKKIDTLNKYKRTAFEKQIKNLQNIESFRKISKETCDSEQIVRTMDSSLSKNASSAFMDLNDFYKQILGISI